MEEPTEASFWRASWDENLFWMFLHFFKKSHITRLACLQNMRYSWCLISLKWWLGSYHLIPVVFPYSSGSLTFSTSGICKDSIAPPSGFHGSPEGSQFENYYFTLILLPGLAIANVMAMSMGNIMAKIMGNGYPWDFPGRCFCMVSSTWDVADGVCMMAFSVVASLLWNFLWQADHHVSSS